MKNGIILNKKYSLDLGSSAPVEVITKKFTKNGVLCEYLNSYNGRVEELSYELFEMNGYKKEDEINIDLLYKEYYKLKEKERNILEQIDEIEDNCEHNYEEIKRVGYEIEYKCKKCRKIIMK